MSISKELFQYASELSDFENFDAPEIKKIIDVANDFGNAWSGSWLGYHSRVYYAEFQTPLL